MRRSLAAISRIFAVIFALMLFGQGSQAHFQMLYTPDLAPVRGQATHLVMPFSHPVHGGPNMDINKPEAFYMLSQRGRAAQRKKVDLMSYLTPVTWSSSINSSAAFEAKLPRKLTRSLGDYVFVLQPSPYYEAEEDKYIQQYTKTVMNVGAVPGNWADPADLPVEIIPLDKPYANWRGGVFRGVVTAGGKPVPYAALEIEYINYRVDMKLPGFVGAAAVQLPQDSFGTMGIKTNAVGEFVIGLPRAGWWGICALDLVPGSLHKGKPLSVDAVLWLQAREMN